MYASFSGVTVTTHVCVPASLILKGLSLTVVVYGGMDIGILITVIRFPSSARLVPFLFQVPCTVTGVFTALSRVMLQVKARSNPTKKPSFKGEPVLTTRSGRGGTAKMNYEIYYFTGDPYNYYTLHDKDCCICPLNSSPWNGEHGSTGVDSSMSSK